MKNRETYHHHKSETLLIVMISILVLSLGIWDGIKTASNLDKNIIIQNDTLIITENLKFIHQKNIKPSFLWILLN